MQLKSPRRLSPPVVLAPWRWRWHRPARRSPLAAWAAATSRLPHRQPALSGPTLRALRVRSESSAVLTGRCCRVWGLDPEPTIGPQAVLTAHGEADRPDKPSNDDDAKARAPGEILGHPPATKPLTS